MGPPPWSLRKTDAHDCIMVPDSDESTAYKFAGRSYARARREAPLGIAALTKPPCNEKLCPSTVRSELGESKLWLDINRPIQVPMRERLGHTAIRPMQFAFGMGDGDPAVAGMVVITGIFREVMAGPGVQPLRRFPG